MRYAAIASTCAGVLLPTAPFCFSQAATGSASPSAAIEVKGDHIGESVSQLVAVEKAIHDRMPVVLDASSYDLWLDPGMTNVDAASDVLKPYDARLMRCYPVSTRINQVAKDDAECSVPAEMVQGQSSLFS